MSKKNTPKASAKKSPAAKSPPDWFKALEEIKEHQAYSLGRPRRLYHVSMWHESEDVDNFTDFVLPLLPGEALQLARGIVDAAMSFGPAIQV